MLEIWIDVVEKDLAAAGSTAELNSLSRCGLSALPQSENRKRKGSCSSLRSFSNGGHG